MQEKHHRPPPDASDFETLFHFMWKHGIGNDLSQTGDPVPWTDLSLEAAFETVGKSVDKRTVQNWLSGKNQPTTPNLHKLARIASGGDNDLRHQ